MMRIFDRICGLAILFTSVNMLKALYNFHDQLFFGAKPLVGHAGMALIVTACALSLWGGLRLLFRSAR